MLLVLFSNPMVRTHYMPAWDDVDRIFLLLVCILLDVGTKPTGTSIYELWKCMPLFLEDIINVYNLY